MRHKARKEKRGKFWWEKTTGEDDVNKCLSQLIGRSLTPNKKDVAMHDCRLQVARLASKFPRFTSIRHGDYNSRNLEPWMCQATL